VDRIATIDKATVVLINSKSGTVRSMGAEAAARLVENEIAHWPGASEVHLIDGTGITDAVAKMVASGRFNRIIVGGGDGTVASVAGQLAGTAIALGILPMGTMNLMAKALGIAPALSVALGQLKDAHVRSIDAARAGDRLFLHHISFGIQPRMVKIRERIGYSSRMTKMLSGARAMISVLFKSQSLRLKVNLDGQDHDLRTPALIVSNNIYEDSVWLKQARLDEGLLGLYAVRPMSKLALLRLALDLLRGRWRDNLNVEESHGRRVIIEKRRRFGGKSRGIVATIDGELTLLESPLEIRIDPRVLQVLVPAQRRES
jgi:diacylglycerol kinase family enzyme